MVCNGICDLFVMVLEFSVMVLLCFFHQGCLIVFISFILTHFKGCCWLRSVFITTNIYIYCLNTSLIMNIAYLKDMRALFSSFFFFSAPDC